MILICFDVVDCLFLGGGDFEFVYEVFVVCVGFEVEYFEEEGYW